MKILYQGEKVSVTSTLKNPSTSSGQAMLKNFKKLPFDKIKDGILGRNYELSIVLVGKTKIKNLNTKYRKKNHATDVLSFSISKTEGEIFICPKVAEKKASEFKMTYDNYLIFLVIHASFHLKGLEHGDKMERYEFAHYNRYRHRHL